MTFNACMYSSLNFSLLRRPLTSALLVLALGSAWAQGVQVPTLVLQVRDTPAGFDMEGVVEPVRQSTVSAQATGRVVALRVRAGERVRAGQVLLTIDDRDTQLALQRSQAQLTQTDGELSQARINLERTRDLQRQGFVSQAALDMAQTKFQSAQAQREQAQAASRQSGLAQGFTQVTAPYDGWVMQTLADPGDLVMPGKPLLVIYAPQPLRVAVQLPASRAELARQATQVTLQLPPAAGQTHWITPTQRTEVPATDAMTQTALWRFDLSAQDAKALQPGAPVRVRFAGGQTAPRLWIPSSAVLRRGELTAVYVASEAGFSLRAVRLGAALGDDGLAVLAGLAAGERVALDPVRAGLAGARAMGAPSTENGKPR